jgi:arsenate reductase (thioredoxin)
MKVLILCTGNSCRSQMAHGLLQAMDMDLVVRSAGTRPSGYVHPLAVKVMAELGLDISGHVSTHVDKYLDEPWDYVITVCGDAEENCPVFPGRVGQRLHIGFEDPAHCQGDEAVCLPFFREIRDQIRERFTVFYQDHVLKN